MSKSKRYRAVVAYDGTEFHGFQRQTDHRRTVQGEIESVLRKIGWPGSTIWAAGRTDAGVHAAGQVIAFDHRWDHGPERLQQAINAQIPSDLAFHRVEYAAPDFHPRYAAVSRTYLYRFHCSPVNDPLRVRYVHRVWPRPEVERMSQAAVALIGEHDFSGFGSPPQPGGETVRKVRGAEVRRQEDEILFTIEANAFLYRMVRKLAQALLEVGSGRIEQDQWMRVLGDPETNWTGRIAPAKGLCLADVRY